MATKSAWEWVEVAQMAGTVIAAAGLLLTALQLSRTRRTADLQAIQKFSEDANKREATLVDAKSDDERRRAFVEFLNFLELYACAYNNGLVLGNGSKDIVRHKLLDSYIELDGAKEWHPQIAAALDRPTTFSELTKLVTRHRAEIRQRRPD